MLAYDDEKEAIR
ncbi:uncharacterized, partial [Tachysurus ichikawai]